MHKGYGSYLVCESVCLCVCPSVCLSVTALAASAYVYTAKQHAQVHVRMYSPAPEMGGVSIARLLFSDWSQFSTQAYTPRKLPLSGRK